MSRSDAASDADVLSLVADGDEDAMAELFRRYERRVRAFARQRLNDDATSFDILSDVMLEVWKSAGRFEGRSSVSTWILSIARHRTLDQLRKRGDRVFEEADESLPAEGIVAADEALAAASDGSKLRFCLERLPDGQREAVHLAFFEDLGYADIAGILSCPEGTVKTRVYHAKRALKRCLTSDFHGDADA